MPDVEMLLTELFSGLADASYSFNFATSGLGVLVYILQALALYTIAKRREIKKPWMAWVPLVNVWILGSISDQYQYVVKRQVKNKRKVLLGLNIAMTAIGVVIVVAAVWLLAALMLMAISIPAISDPETLLSNLMYYAGNNVVLLNLLAVAAFLTIPLAVLVVIHVVYFYMALYDLLRSCDPKNTTLYFVLGLVGNVVVEGAYSIFMILCKDKDLGMPPRKQDVAVSEETPAEIPENTEE